MNAARTKKPSRKEVVRLNAGEWTRVAQKAVEMILDGNAKNPNDAFNIALGVLPADRQPARGNDGRAYISTFGKSYKPIFEAVMARAMAKKAEEAAAASAPPPSPTSTEPEETGESPYALEARTEPAPPLEPPVLIPLNLKPVVDVLATAIGNLVSKLLLDAVTSHQFKQTLEHNMTPLSHVEFKGTVEVKKKMPRVLVVGLLGSQAQTIAQEFGDKLDLRFLTQEDSSDRIRQNAQGADITFAMVGYMGHHVEKAIRSGTDHFHRVNGTVGELRRLLTGYINGAVQ